MQALVDFSIEKINFIVTKVVEMILIVKQSESVGELKASYWMYFILCVENPLVAYNVVKSRYH